MRMLSLMNVHVLVQKTESKNFTWIISLSTEIDTLVLFTVLMLSVSLLYLLLFSRCFLFGK